MLRSDYVRIFKLKKCANEAKAKSLIFYIGGVKMIVVSSGQLSGTSNKPVMMSIPNQVRILEVFNTYPELLHKKIQRQKI